MELTPLEKIEGASLDDLLIAVGAILFEGTSINEFDIELLYHLKVLIEQEIKTRKTH
tara:strand:- start:496 stop:666 length:171 start_codon:yes stop_codon:yes gene_type:complete